MLLKKWNMKCSTFCVAQEMDSDEETGTEMLSKLSELT